MNGFLINAGSCKPAGKMIPTPIGMAIVFLPIDTNMMYTISMIIAIALAALPNTRISFAVNRLASESTGLKVQIQITARMTALVSSVATTVLSMDFMPHTAIPRSILDAAKHIPGFDR